MRWLFGWFSRKDCDQICIYSLLVLAKFCIIVNSRTRAFQCDMICSVFSDSFITPAPGAYHPERVHPPRERYPPKYSIGFRARHRRYDQNPPSSKYLLPSVMGPRQPNKMSAASYSLTGTFDIWCIVHCKPLSTFVQLTDVAKVVRPMKISSNFGPAVRSNV